MQITVDNKEFLLEFNGEKRFVYDGSSKAFYQFSNPFWEMVGDEKLRSMIAKQFDYPSKRQISEYCEALRCSTYQEIKWNSGGDCIVFKNGILSIRVLLERLKLSTSIPMKPADLAFRRFDQLEEKELKSRYLLQSIGCNFDPDTKIDRFQKYLDSTFEGNEEQINLVQEIIGYCMIYPYLFQKFFLLIGGGGNGKGILLHIIRAICGESNTANIRFTELSKFSKLFLKDKLVNITDELPKKLDLDLLKNLTGGGVTDAEIKFGGRVDFLSTAKLIFTANDYPLFNDYSVAFWSRAIILPFNNSFRGTKREIPGLQESLMEELDAISYWALEGLLRLFNNKEFSISEANKQIVDSMKRESCSIASFVEENCNLDERCAEYSLPFYGQYQAYCKHNGFRPLNHSLFSKRLEGMGVDKVRESSSVQPRKSLYQGIGCLSYFEIGEGDFGKITEERPAGFCLKPGNISSEDGQCKNCKEADCFFFPS